MCFKEVYPPLSLSAKTRINEKTCTRKLKKWIIFVPELRVYVINVILEKTRIFT